MAGKQLPREVRNGQTKQRNANRKAANIEKMEKKVKLTPIQQLAELDFRLGIRQGAKKERAKLAKKMKAVA